MPAASSVNDEGYIIYTENGIQASKMSIKDLSESLDILNTPEEEDGDNNNSAGFAYWEEFIDYQNYSYLLAYSEDDINPSLANTSESNIKYTVGRDIWTANNQYDAWDTGTAPHYPGVFEIKKTINDVVQYRPYVAFTLLHRIGSSIYDFTNLGDDLYKIKTDELGKYRAYIFFIYPPKDQNPQYETVIGPDTNLEPVTYFEDLTFQSDYSGLGLGVSAYEIDGAFMTGDSAISHIFELFDNDPINNEGYFRHNYVDYTQYIDDSVHEDDDEYTYILNPVIEENKVEFSDDDLSYYEVDDTQTAVTNSSYPAETIQKLAYGFAGLIGVGFNPFYTVYGSKGIFFGVPFTREQNNNAKPQLALDFAKARYTSSKAEFFNETGDVIYINGEAFIDYCEEAFGGGTGAAYISEINIGDETIEAYVDDGVATILLGTGLKVTVNNEGYCILGVDTDQLQPTLTAGTGVTISNNTISSVGKIQDVLVDGVTVVDPSDDIAKIYLPGGMKEAVLVDGNYTDVTVVSEDEDNITYQIDISGLENAVTQNSAQVTPSASDISNWSSSGMTKAVVDITIPERTSGWVYGTLSINGANITDGVAMMDVANRNYWPNSDATAYAEPGFDSKNMIDNSQTALRCAVYVNNTNYYDVTYTMVAKIISSVPYESMSGTLSLVTNIDV